MAWKLFNYAWAIYTMYILIRNFKNELKGGL